MDCMVLNADGVVFGRIFGDAWERDPSLPVEDVMEPSPAAIRADTFITDAIRRLRERGLESLPVTTFGERGGGRYAGMLHTEDVERILRDVGLDEATRS